MSAFSNYLEDKIVAHFLQAGSIASPANVYLALFIADPTEDVDEQETTYIDYARQASGWTNLDVNGQTQNDAPLAFPANNNASASVTITYAAIFDALINGSPLLYGPLANPKTLAVGDVLSFATNALTLTLD